MIIETPEAFVVMLLTALSLVGCESPSGRRDVDLNTINAIEEAEQWLISSPPEVTLGLIDGPPEFQFDDVRDATLGADRIFILDNGSKEVRIFDRIGRHRVSIGGEGEGPGEFVFPTGLEIIEDTLVVWDTRLRRLTYFSPFYEIVRIRRLTQDLQNPSLAAVFTDGSFALSDHRPVMPAVGEESVATKVVRRYSAAGELMDTLGEYPQGAMLRWGDVRELAPRLFGPQTPIAGDRRGIWVARADTPVILGIQPEGDTLLRVPWETPDRSVSEERVERYFAELLEREGGTEGDRGRLGQWREHSPVAERFPPADRIAIDREGRIWVRRYERPGRPDAQRWLVFAADGVIRARVDMSRDLEFLDSEDMYLLALRRDALDVEKIELYQMEIARQ